MPTEKTEMHVLREILRQKLALGRSHRQVAAAVGVSAGKVASVHLDARALGLDAAAVDAMSDAELDARLYPKTPPSCMRPEPDCLGLHAELRRPGVTLALLHMEYRTEPPNGLRYTAFCTRYREWSKRQSPVMRQVHVAGDKMFVDYAGKKPSILDPQTGEVIEVELFVAVLGASNYTYVEATRTQRVVDFVSSVSRAFSFFGGVTRAVVPDQLKSAVTTACRYDPAIQRTMAELGRHYATTILPARPKSPRDKAKVEVGVQIVERWVLAKIRNERFESIGGLNARLFELTADLNSRMMRTYKASRRELYERLDKPALSALPEQSFEAAAWKKVSLNIDYHIEFDHHLYSAPHTLLRQELWVRATTRTIEILHADTRVASHVRSYVHGNPTTLTEHMPSSHRAQAEWTPTRILSWADSVGPNTRALCEVILRERHHPEWGFRSCLGLFRLAKKYDPARVDRACARALYSGARSYRPVKTILQHNLDSQPLPNPEVPATAGSMHKNVRGRDYYH